MAWRSWDPSKGAGACPLPACAAPSAPGRRLCKRSHSRASRARYAASEGARAGRRLRVKLRAIEGEPGNSAKTSTGRRKCRAKASNALQSGATRRRLGIEEASGRGPR
jgi:hypothetical protein